MKLNEIQNEVLTTNLTKACELSELIHSASIDNTNPSDTLVNWSNELELLFILLDDIRGAFHCK